MRRQAVTSPGGSKPTGEGARGLPDQQLRWRARGPGDVAEPLDRMHAQQTLPGRREVGSRPGRLANFLVAMATDVLADLELTALTGEPRTVGEWVTTFHLAWSSSIRTPTRAHGSSRRPGASLRAWAADVRVGWLVTGTADEARQFLGPWADKLLTFADPDRTAGREARPHQLPAFVHVNSPRRGRGRGVEPEGVEGGGQPLPRPVVERTRHPRPPGPGPFPGP